MKRIIISGASGFLGTNIIRKAIETDSLQVTAITTSPDRLSEEFGSEIQTVNTNTFLENGLTCSADDVFVNCLFPTNADGLRMANGLQMAFQMMDAAYESGVGAFINISSQSVYASRRTQPAAESDELCLETSYAVGKFSTEAYCNRVFHDRPHSNIRLASLLGVGYEQRIVNRMAKQALNVGQLKVVGGMQRYGFLDVRDAAAAIVCMAQSNSDTWKSVYNLGRNDSCTLMDVVSVITDVLKSEYGITAAHTVEDGVDMRNSSIDASRFMQDFGWSPVFTLKETTEWIMNNLSGGAAI